MIFWICLQSFTLVNVLWVVDGGLDTKPKRNVTRHSLIRQGKIQNLTLADKQNGRRNMSMNAKTLRLKDKHHGELAPKNTSQRNTHSISEKHHRFFSGKRKSIIDIQQNQANSRSPVMYTSKDGQDQFITLRNNDNLDDTPIDLNLPSRTFLVTVYGDQIEGAEEKLRDALTNPSHHKCPCKCSTTPCETEEECPCEEETEENPHTGGYKLVIFPNAGKPLGSHGCVCPCCLCSCSEPWYENYRCGCQASPPVPCPCSSGSNNGIQPQTPLLTVFNSSPTSTKTDGNHIAPWTGEASSCPCTCCQCACAQPQSYPSYHCGCASQPAIPCPCNSNYDQSSSQNNVARSPDKSSYPSTSVSSSYASQPSWYSPYPPTANNHVAQSSESSPYTPSAHTNNGPLTQTFRSGDYLFENSCDCYCCPCSCPGTEYSSYDSSHCNCGQVTQAACTCRRSGVQPKIKNN